jgi:amino-acid N-acetyltransferase
LSRLAVSVTAAEPSQFDRIIALLEEARLPTRDLTRDSLGGFLVATDGEQVVGAVGLERYGDVGLLRSLVVAPAHKRQGLAKAMVRGIEERARGKGLTSLVLLTETAKEFFSALGYETGQRANAPAAVQASSEFAFVCPVSAVYMEKRLR